MGQTTGIKWTEATANFWWGCQRVSPGCEHCYAEQLATVRRKLPVWGPPKTTRRDRKKDVWADIVKWNAAAAREGRRLKVFVSSMADVFEDHPQVAPWRAEALALLETLTSLDVQLLTKRPQNIRAMVPPHWLTAWPAHVWIGTTVEDQRRAEERIPHLLDVPAPVRFLSMEPLLEAVDLSRWLFDGTCRCGSDSEHTPDSDCPYEPRVEDGVEWVIVGGESGPRARPFNLAWAHSIVAQCRAAGVACFVKQMGDNPVMEPGPITWPCAAHHGADPSEWPEALRVQEFPAWRPA